MKNYKFISGLLALSMTLSPVMAMAHGADASVGVHEKGEVRAEGEAHSWFNWSKLMPTPDPAKVCTQTEAKIDAVINKYDTNKDAKVNAYLNLKTKVAQFQTMAAAAGYDTTALQAHMVVLNTKVDKFAADYQAYINSLKLLRTYTCGDADGKFAAQLVVAKGLLATARTSGKDARDYFKDTVRPDIMTIWTQIKANLDFSL